MNEPYAWPLDDLAGVSELADQHEVGRAAVCNWAERYPDFPAPLLTLAAGRIYSRQQVAAWRTRTTSTPTGWVDTAVNLETGETTTTPATTYVTPEEFVERFITGGSQ